MKIIHPRGAHPCPRAFQALCSWPGGCPSHFLSCPGRQLSAGPPLPSVILHFSPLCNSSSNSFHKFPLFVVCRPQNHKACGACPLLPRAQGRGCTGPAAPGHHPHRPGTTGVSRGPPCGELRTGNCLPDTPPVFAAEPDHVGRAGGRPKEGRRQCYSLPQGRFLNMFILNQAPGHPTPPTPPSSSARCRGRGVGSPK